jgi:hypothetical protein
MRRILSWHIATIDPVPASIGVPSEHGAGRVSMGVGDQGRCWAMRVDHWAASAFLWDELQAGRLRQGWGHKPEQDLRVIAEALARSETLTTDQQRCWRGNRRLLGTEPDALKVGDMMLVPHLPNYGVWSLVRVAGDYRFDVHAGTKDYGHVLPVDLISRHRAVHPHEKSSSAPLRRSMRARQRLWSLDAFRGELAALEADLAAGAPVPKALNPFEEMLRSARDALWTTIQKRFQGHELELPCVRLLEAIYGKGSVEHTGGCAEKGADAVVTHIDELGLSHCIVVQMKMWDGEASSLHPLDQIRQAVASRDLVTGGVVLSTAKRSTADFEATRARLEAELGIPVRTIWRDELLTLFLRHLPGLVEGSAGE